MSDVTAQNDELLRAYNATFGTRWGKLVLTDLAAFCRASESTIVRGDQQASDVLAGRREAFLRIQAMSQLSEDEILQLRMERIRSIPQETD